MYTLSDAAKAVGKSKSTVSEAIRKGKLPASKDGMGRYIIDPADLNRVYPPSGSPERRATERVTGEVSAAADRPVDDRPVEQPNAPTGAPTERATGDPKALTGEARAAADRSADDGPVAQPHTPTGAPTEGVTGGRNAPTGETRAAADRSVDDRPVEQSNAPVSASTERVTGDPKALTGETRAAADRSVDERPVEQPNALTSGSTEGVTGDRNALTGEARAAADRSVDERPVEQPNALTSGSTDRVTGDRNALTGEARAAAGQPVDDRPVERTPTDSFEAENRMLRAQVDRLTAELEAERAQSGEQIDRMISALESERAHSREIADRIEKLEAAAHAPQPGPQMAYPVNGVPPNPQNAEPDLTALLSEIETMRAETKTGIADSRSALAFAIQDVHAKLTARPGLLYRAVMVLPVAWCVLSGFYVAGFWFAFGSIEFWRIGQLSISALAKAFWSYWPF